MLHQSEDVPPMEPRGAASQAAGEAMLSLDAVWSHPIHCSVLGSRCGSLSARPASRIPRLAPDFDIGDDTRQLRGFSVRARSMAGS
jgi:hypothetical protein